ncbi:hypothetical protein ColLi_02237 [Colletotrichum liriopes]|uniref:Uncharacterized protein n=1 Tax=Colletotrichum liriopes TaxID=708192 RepID=A0AA37GEU2_9PEZI|nr:hypothetical protein ColLi_02237 [Colletotrichum liriopes]
MDDVPTSVDDEIIHSLAGSPSDALFGLDNSDFGDSTEPNDTDVPMDENMFNENPTETTPDETMANNTTTEDTIANEVMSAFGGVDSSINTVADNTAQGPAPTTTEGAETSTKIYIGNDEHIPSVEDKGAHAFPTTAIVSSVEPADGFETEDAELQRPEWRTCKFEIVLPYLSPEERAQYISITSDVVNEVIDKVTGSGGEVCYKTEFTDGRQDIVSLFSHFSSIESLSVALAFQL